MSNYPRFPRKKRWPHENQQKTFANEEYFEIHKVGKVFDHKLGLNWTIRIFKVEQGVIEGFIFQNPKMMKNGARYLDKWVTFSFEISNFNHKMVF